MKAKLNSSQSAIPIDDGDIQPSGFWWRTNTLTNMFKIKLLLILSLVFCLGFIANLVFTTLTKTVQLHSTASLKLIGVSVYSDVNGLEPVIDLYWGSVEPNQTVTLTVYVKNDGNTPITLIIYADNWQPLTAQNYLTFSTDYANQTIYPANLLQINFHLHIDPNIIGITTFSFDIYVQAIG